MMKYTDSQNSAPALDDSSVLRAMEDYSAALKAGRKPDRDAFLAQHPHIAGFLAECLDGLEFVCQAVPELSQANGDRSSPVIGEIEPTAPLGDFRILREVGRGGMGVVYEAEQMSLGRRVALKVLPFAGALDPRQLQRFKNEAQAAAHLHHQNIVPVHFVGCERSVHFYAMQFVEGQTLAQVIAELRHEHGKENQVASRSASVPGAKKEDHRPKIQNGVSDPAATGTYRPASDGSNGPHEEVKEPTVEDRLDTLPIKSRSSILGHEASTLSPKSLAFFRTVAQLGIQAADAIDHAHQMGIIHRDIKPSNLLIEDSSLRLWITDFGLAQFQAGAELTMTGDLIGTLRYMSPEQALAKRVIVDHRTDIYSMGATLYELLTLRPPYEGNDRQELLRRIAFEEPRPLRRINPRIPAELETIVLKALEKNPLDRYATARELADDLRRYLQHEPIRAKKPTWMQRAGKWSRRHPAFVRAAVVMLFLITAGSSLSTLLVWQEKQKTGLERNRAEEQRRQARKAVDTMYTKVAEKWLANQPEMAEQEREFLTAALEFYQQFAQEEGTDPEHQLQTALAYMRVGNIQNAVFRENAQAETAQLQAIRILEKLVHEFPAEPDYAERLGRSYEFLGGAREEISQEKEKWERRALELYEALWAAHPGERKYRDVLANGLVNLGASLGDTGREREQEMIHRRVVALLEASPAHLPRTPDEIMTLAVSYGNFSWTLEVAGRLEEALDCCQKCIEWFMQLTGKNLDVPNFQCGMNRNNWAKFAILHVRVSRILQQTGKSGHARPFIERSIRIFEGLVARSPKTSSRYATHLLGSYLGLASIELACGRGEAADNACKEGFRIAEQLDPLNKELANCLMTCPVARFRDNQRALKILEKAITITPEDADTWRILALARYRTNKWTDALEAAKKARRYGGAEYFLAAFVEAMAHWQLGNKEEALRCYQEADQWLEKGHLGLGDPCRERDEARALFGIKRPEKQNSISPQPTKEGKPPGVKEKKE